MKSTFNKKNSGASVKRSSASSAASAAASSAFRLKVVKPSTPSTNSYQFECALDGDFLNNLALQIGVSDSATVTDITDDLKLESFFLQQALAAAVAGRSRLEACGRTFTRPPTYHAHLLKTVSHLQKIQRVEAEERKSREASMDAKRQRLLKATAKKVQQETLMERQKSRSDDRKKLEAIKKKAKTAGGAEGSSDDEKEKDDFNVETVVEDIIKNKKDTKHIDTHKKEHKKPLLAKPKYTSANPKRQSKDKKFGFGGKDAKQSKRNTKDSVNDLSGFSKLNTKSSSFGGVGKKQKAAERGSGKFGKFAKGGSFGKGRNGSNKGGRRK